MVPELERIQPLLKVDPCLFVLFVEFGYSVHFDVEGQNDYNLLKLAWIEKGIALRE